MRTFSRTSQFKKDVKRTEKRGKDMAKLKAALERLIDGEPLPAEFKDHPLRGNFAGSRDCHIEPDWVLIYTLTEKDTHVRFERTGTHRRHHFRTRRRSTRRLPGRNPKKLFLEEPLLGWGKLKPAAGKPLPEKMTAGIV